MTQHLSHTIRGAYFLVGSGLSLTRWPVMREHEEAPAPSVRSPRAGEDVGCQVFSGRA